MGAVITQTTDVLDPDDAQNGVVNTTTAQVAEVDHPEGEAIRCQVSYYQDHVMGLR
jgi:hypothetical protein